MTQIGKFVKGSLKVSSSPADQEESKQAQLRQQQRGNEDIEESKISYTLGSVQV